MSLQVAINYAQLKEEFGKGIPDQRFASAVNTALDKPTSKKAISEALGTKPAPWMDTFANRLNKLFLWRLV